MSQGKKELKLGRSFYIAMIVGGGIGMLVGLATDLPLGISVGLGTGVGAIVGMRQSARRPS
jgi:hypothetical protein